MSSLNRIKTRKLAQISGIIISHIVSLDPIARIRTRSMYHCLKTRLLQSEHYSSSESYNREITIDKNTHEEARFWIKNIQRFNGQSILKIFSVLSFFFKLGSDTSSSNTIWPHEGQNQSSHTQLSKQTFPYRICNHRPVKTRNWYLGYLHPRPISKIELLERTLCFGWTIGSNRVTTLRVYCPTLSRLVSSSHDSWRRHTSISGKFFRRLKERRTTRISYSNLRSYWET